MKQYVIFGAASAIAQETAKIWAKEQAQFVLLDRNSEHLEIVAQDLRTRGAKDVRTIATDFTELQDHKTLVSELPQDSGTVYLIAYGTLGDQKKSEADFSIAQKELTTNFTSVASLLTELTNSLTGSHGKNPENITIAVISSVAGDRGRRSNYVYGTAKAALTSWLSGLRNRLAHEAPNIHVLTIKPGMVDTPMTAHMKKGLLFVKPQKIAKDIVRGIDKQKDVIYTPVFWTLVMLIIRNIPERIFKRLTL